MIIDTPIGVLRIFCEKDSVVEVLLPGWRSGITPQEDEPVNAYEKKVAKAFNDYFSASNFQAVKAAWKKLVDVAFTKKKVEGVSNFHAKVYRALTDDVESSTTVSYKELAALAGNPLAARAVGTAMRKNPLPIIVPCHRVIAADGSLGGYMGASNEDGLVIKKWLLHHEGVL